jgi:aminoacyl-tRNA hydrolase
MKRFLGKIKRAFSKKPTGSLKETLNWFSKGVLWKTRVGISTYRAMFHRRKLSKTTFIGITGSAGKTTTKEFATAILSKFDSTLGSPESWNEIYPISQTVLKTKDHKYTVIEMHGGNPNALDLPLKIVKPTVGVLTNITRDHFKRFDNLNGIAIEKRKLIDQLPPEGTAVLNIDDEQIREIGTQCKANIIWVGKDPKSDVRLISSSSNWPQTLTIEMAYKGQQYIVETSLHGTHLSLVVLNTIAVCLAVGKSIDEIIEKVKLLEPYEARMQPVKVANDVTFIRDDWKAPHWSVHFPVAFMKNAQAKRKIIIVGTVSDYSTSASKTYKKLGRLVKDSCDLALFVGPHSHRALKALKPEEEGQMLAFAHAKSLSAYLKKSLQPGDLVLLKGSHKADHLVRVILDYETEIQCWKEKCGKGVFCDKCHFLYQPYDSSHLTVIDDNHLDKNTNNDALIVGLGNPWNTQNDTAHNAGSRVIDNLAVQLELTWLQGDSGAFATAHIYDRKVHLLKPNHEVNHSGPKIKGYMVTHGINPKSLLIIHDDTDLMLGTLKVKRSGSHNGHNGLKSAIENLNTDQFQRLRVGVREEQSEPAKTFVLKPYQGEPLERFKEACDNAAALALNTINSESGS